MDKYCVQCEVGLEDDEAIVVVENPGHVPDWQDYEYEGPPVFCSDCAASVKARIAAGDDLVPCNSCGLLCEVGDGAVDHCESCQQYFHSECDQGWHDDPYSHHCSRCRGNRSRRHQPALSAKI